MPAVVTSLTDEQRVAVERGVPLQVLETVPQSSWPRSRVYQFIDAAPEEGAAVFADYERHPLFAPRVKSAHIVAMPDSRTTVVHFVIDVPFYPDEQSDISHRVTCRDSFYELAWHTIGDTTGKSTTNGSALFQPWDNKATGRRGTLFVYEQLVVPSSAFARLSIIRRRGIATSRDAARAVARQVERERVDDPRTLAAQRDRLRSALADSTQTQPGDNPCQPRS
jgi:hypothetical protein